MDLELRPQLPLLAERCSIWVLYQAGEDFFTKKTQQSRSPLQLQALQESSRHSVPLISWPREPS